MKKLWLALAFVTLAGIAAAHAQTYPSRPITIVIGYTPGAVSDLTARTIADGLHQAWAQPVIVDNRPGSGGNIGAVFVSRAAPDGYMLMMGTDATMASNVHLYKHAGFDPVSVGGLEQARALEDHLALVFAVNQAGLGPFFYRIARPGEL